MDIQDEIISYGVSRETMQKLEKFVAILCEWNEKMNLVSKNSLSDVWVRHILDCVQLLKYIDPNTHNLVDIGSGAGFPGIVLAILMKEKMPEVKFFLVESIAKKTAYLKEVCARIGLDNVEIVNERVENAVFKDVDVITARAVAALDKLFDYAYPITKKKTKMIFPKGVSYGEELSSAKHRWNFKQIIHPNKYCEGGVILEIEELEKRR